jgi:hypothetical protein
MNRNAFTLLEVILALSLVVVVLGLVGLAVDIHLRLGDKGRTEVEEAQVARAVLHRIADDLRGAVADFSTQSSATTESSTESKSSSESVASAAAQSSGENVELSDGFRGNLSQLQFSAACLSRPGRPSAKIGNDATGTPTARPDAKIIRYYVVDPTESPSQEVTDDAKPRHGLMRWETDRAAGVFASRQGQTTPSDPAAEAIAPEVAALEFAYLDGALSYDTWDTQLLGKLPTAVKISIALRRKTQSQSSRADDVADEAKYRLYSLLVYLPGPRQPSQQTSGGTSSSSSTSATQTNSSSTGSQSSGSTQSGGARGGESR